MQEQLLNDGEFVCLRLIASSMKIQHSDWLVTFGVRRSRIQAFVSGSVPHLWV